MGVSVMDTTPDTRMAAVIVTANSRNSRPSTPVMKRIGMKTAASDVVITMIVNAISFEPASDASSALSPISMWRTMFSSITIASSTTKPIERMSAIIDRLLRLKPRSCMTVNVPRSEKGSASAGMSVADPLCRNRKMTPTTSTSVISIVVWMSTNAARIVLDRSCRGARCAEPGSWVFRIGSSARTRSATSIVFVPGCRMTCREMARTCCGVPSLAFV